MTFQRWHPKFLLPLSLAYQGMLTSGHVGGTSFPGHQLMRVACSKDREVVELATGPCAIKIGQDVTFGTYYCYKLMTVSPWHLVRITET